MTTRHERNRIHQSVGAVCTLVICHAVQAQVAYSNLGPDASFSQKDGTFLAYRPSGGMGANMLWWQCPVERSGTLGKVELALRHVDGANEYLINIADTAWTIAAAGNPGDLVMIDVAAAGIQLTAGEPIGIAIGSTSCEGVSDPLATAFWHANDQERVVPVGHGFRSLCFALIEDCVCGGTFLGYEPAIRLTLSCPADFNRDGGVNSTDVSDFINAWFEDQGAGTLITDWNNDGVSNSTDVSDFISSWFEDTATDCAS